MRGEFVDLSGTRIYYYAAGSRGGGDPVVFLHGFPGSSHCWRLMVPHMPQGRRLVVADLMGCGRSDGTDVRAATFAAHVSLTLALLDDLSIARAAIIGHGLGGALGQALAVDHPDRVSALCLISSLAFDIWPRRLARLARAVSPAARLVGAPMLAGFVHGSAVRGYVDRDAGRRSLDQSLRAYPARLGAAPLVAHLRVPRDPDVAGVGKRLATIAAPTAIIWGAADPFLPCALGERLRAAIPGATLNVIPDARHFVPEDAPEQCARVASALLAR